MSFLRKMMIFLLVGSVLFSTLTACVPSSDEVNLEMTPVKVMPAQVQSAPITVQQAYQFASANPEVMRDIPCYCGCGAVGHSSNYSCYVAKSDQLGNLTFDNHALGCSICVDITQDVMRMMRQRQSPEDIQASIDTTYSKFGPSNIP